MYFLLVSLIGYLFGCLNGSQLVSKLKNIDIKNSGSKNAGATNTTILLGWKYGIVVALIDIFKATFAILLVISILERNGIYDELQSLLVYVTVFFVIIGHNYPVTMKFRGGKGTASLVGSFLAIDIKIAMIGIFILLLFTLATDYAVIGVLSMYFAFLVTTYMFYGLVPARIVLVLSLLSMVKHRENFKRIMSKEEIKLSSLYRRKIS